MNTVINKEECGYNMIEISGFGSSAPLVGIKGFKICDKLDIDHVVLIDNKTKKAKGAIEQQTNKLVGTLLFGWIGAVFSGGNETQYDVDYDIYLTDGRVIELHTNEERMIKKLDKYLVVQDKRIKYRNMRGVI